MMHSRISIACDLTNQSPPNLRSIYPPPIALLQYTSTTTRLWLLPRHHALVLRRNMASAEIQQALGHSTTFEPLQAVETKVASSSSKAHNVSTKLNYYKDPGDGSAPEPAYVGRPETYDRPTEPFDVVVQDIRGQEDQYTLDKNGFQIYRHTSVEKDFASDEQIKAVYYPETEQLLKDAYGSFHFLH